MLFWSQTSNGQNSHLQQPVEQTIEDLLIYPNPVSKEQNTIYISSKLNTQKHVEFYDVLGKLILSTSLHRKALDIGNLEKGIYILRITENNISETRKLIIK